MKKEVKPKICADNDCQKPFKPFRTTDKYCSGLCATKNTKPLKKTPIKPKPLSSKKLWNSIKDDPFEIEFNKQKIKLKKQIKQKNDGRLICERCLGYHSIQFSVHHIVYRSEKPKHPHLNDLRNLIHLCFDCHEWYHNNKQRRKSLVTDRKLYELFGNLYGYEER